MSVACAPARDFDTSILTIGTRPTATGTLMSLRASGLHGLAMGYVFECLDELDFTAALGVLLSRLMAGNSGIGRALSATDHDGLLVPAAVASGIVAAAQVVGSSAGLGTLSGKFSPRQSNAGGWVRGRIDVQIPLGLKWTPERMFALAAAMP